jgi:hypothetical protein
MVIAKVRLNTNARDVTIGGQGVFSFWPYFWRIVNQIVGNAWVVGIATAIYASIIAGLLVGNSSDKSV